MAIPNYNAKTGTFQSYNANTGTFSNYTGNPNANNGSWIGNGNTGNSNSASYSSNLRDTSDYLSAITGANDKANALSISEAQKNRDFQLEMSNTAHQREVADLQKAGLNPVLSANNGACTSSGSTASINDSSGSISGLLGASISALTSIANTQSNNATQVAMNNASLQLQKDLGLANLDMTKYGIDTGYIQNKMTNQTSLSVANINKQIAVLNNNQAYERLVKQGDIDVSKIHTQGDVDILKSIFNGSGLHGEKDYVNSALASAYLVGKGIITQSASTQVSTNRTVKNTHHR